MVYHNDPAALYFTKWINSTNDHIIPYFTTWSIIMILLLSIWLNRPTIHELSCRSTSLNGLNVNEWSCDSLLH